MLTMTSKCTVVDIQVARVLQGEAVTERQHGDLGLRPPLFHRLRSETSARGDQIYDSLLARAGHKIDSRGISAERDYGRLRALVVRLKGKNGLVSMKSHEM